MESFREIQSSEGRGEDLEDEADTYSVPHSGPSESAPLALDEPSSGIQTEESVQSPIQESENLEDLNILISAASNRRKIVDDKVQHELPILDVERQVTEQRQILLSPFNEQSTPTAAMVL
jgi:hypothetical protein